jgi:hypothetical protein
MNQWVPFIGLLSLPIILVGLISIFRPIAKIKITTRKRAVIVFAVGLGAFILAMVTPYEDIPRPVAQDAIGEVTDQQQPTQRAAWIVGADYCTDPQGASLSAHIKARDACSAILNDPTAPQICKDHARRVMRGEYQTFAGGYSATLCVHAAMLTEDPASFLETGPQDDVLRVNADAIRSCLAGNDTACDRVAQSMVMGDCEAYADKLDLNDPNLRGYRKASCEVRLTRATGQSLFDLFELPRPRRVSN